MAFKRILHKAHSALRPRNRCHPEERAPATKPDMALKKYRATHAFAGAALTAMRLAVTKETANSIGSPHLQPLKRFARAPCLGGVGTNGSVELGQRFGQGNARI